ncbi:MAG: hypothetical protein RQ869_03350 [Candidatus Nanopusillus sp.]|jgi:hypothetical protein|nr:hypothetical protein [Candidatus Nanopusillus sp.]
MNSQTPSLNSEKIEINPRVVRYHLGELEKLIHSMNKQIAHYANMSDATNAFTVMGILGLNEPDIFGGNFNAYKLETHLRNDKEEDDLKRYIGHCYSSGHTLIPLNDIECFNKMDNRLYKVYRIIGFSQKYTPQYIIDISRELGNVIYRELSKKLYRELHKSEGDRLEEPPYQTRYMASYILKIYADTYLTPKKTNEPNIKINTNPHDKSSGEILYNNNRSDIKITYRLFRL